MKFRAFFALCLALCLLAGCAPQAVVPSPAPTPSPAQSPFTTPAPTPEAGEAAKDSELAAYFAETFSEGYAAAAYADLTHDGQNELIVVELLEELDSAPVALAQVTDAGAFSAGRVRVFSLAGGAVEQLYEREAHYAHVGWLALYLYADETVAYLFDYSPSVFQGYADYIYSLYALDASGSPAVKESASLSFVISDDGQGGFAFLDSSKKDVSADVAAFEAAAQSYIESSIPLLVYFETFNGITSFDYLH